MIQLKPSHLVWIETHKDHPPSSLRGYEYTKNKPFFPKCPSVYFYPHSSFRSYYESPLTDHWSFRKVSIWPDTSILHLMFLGQNLYFSTLKYDPRVYKYMTSNSVIINPPIMVWPKAICYRVYGSVLPFKGHLTLLRETKFTNSLYT